jgi:hypothetical protein
MEPEGSLSWSQEHLAEALAMKLGYTVNVE